MGPVLGRHCNLCVSNIILLRLFVKVFEAQFSMFIPVKDLVWSHKKRTVSAIISCLVLVVAVYHSNKPLPTGVDHMGDVYTISSSDVEIIADKTYLDESGARQSERAIFDEILIMALFLKLGGTMKMVDFILMLMITTRIPAR